jgi:tetratricopeptide (TPR) repeat protein
MSEDDPLASRRPPAPPSSRQLPELGISASEQLRILELYDTLVSVDHYRLLGVKATDDTKTIRRAYFALAKDHHPDRWFRRVLPPLYAKINAIFVAMTTAHDTLTNEASRAEYNAYLSEVLKTRMARRQAEALEEEDWSAAAAAWGRIVERLPADAYVLHRYAYALLRARKDHDTALAAVQRALDIDPTRPEYHVTAASIFIASGRDRSALIHLEAACEIEPERRDLAGLYAAISERAMRER